MLAVGVGDVHVVHGDLEQHVVQGRLDPVTASMIEGDPVTEAKARWKRLSAWRWETEPAPC